MKSIAETIDKKLKSEKRIIKQKWITNYVLPDLNDPSDVYHSATEIYVLPVDYKSIRSEKEYLPLLARLNEFMTSLIPYHNGQRLTSDVAVFSPIDNCQTRLGSVSFAEHVGVAHLECDFDVEKEGLDKLYAKDCFKKTLRDLTLRLTIRPIPSEEHFNTIVNTPNAPVVEIVDKGYFYSLNAKRTR